MLRVMQNCSLVIAILGFRNLWSWDLIFGIRFHIECYMYLAPTTSDCDCDCYIATLVLHAQNVSFTPCLKKFFGTKMAKMTKLCKMH